MNKLDTTHSARFQGPVSCGELACTADFSRIRSNNDDFLIARLSFPPFLGAKNTEIGFCGPEVLTCGFAAVDTTDLISWNFFSVVGVIVGGLCGSSGRVYSDTGVVYH